MIWCYYKNNKVCSAAGRSSFYQRRLPLRYRLSQAHSHQNHLFFHRDTSIIIVLLRVFCFPQPNASAFICIISFKSFLPHSLIKHSVPGKHHQHSTYSSSSTPNCYQPSNSNLPIPHLPRPHPGFDIKSPYCNPALLHQHPTASLP